MKKELTKQERITIAAIIFFTTLIFCGFIICPSAIGIIKAGDDMAYIRSVGGNSINESYYQAHGEIYKCMGVIILALSLMACVFAGAISGWIIRPILNKEKMMGSVQDFKDRTARAAQAFKSNSEPVKPVVPAKMEEIDGHTGEETNDSLPVERICPACGKKVDDDSRFCEHCGQPISE